MQTEVIVKALSERIESLEKELEKEELQAEVYWTAYDSLLDYLKHKDMHSEAFQWCFDNKKLSKERVEQILQSLHEMGVKHNVTTT